MPLTSATSCSWEMGRVSDVLGSEPDEGRWRWEVATLDLSYGRGREAVASSSGFQSLPF